MAAFSAGCQSVGGGDCPPLVNYSAAQQKMAAGELRRLPQNSQISRLIVDYSKLRAACRIGR